MPTGKKAPVRRSKRSPGKAKPSRRVTTSSSKTAGGRERELEPLLGTQEIRTILFDLATRLAPADVSEIMRREHVLRTRADGLDPRELGLLRRQVNLALDCLHDHLHGRCPQIPYYTIVLLAAAVCYFSDALDIVPDFLPRIGRFDDALVMAAAFHLAHDGLQRYCDFTGHDLSAVMSGHEAEAVD